jgi:hypothetical protein
MSTAAVWQDCDAALVAELDALEIQLHSSIPARWCEIHHIVHWADDGLPVVTTTHSSTIPAGESTWPAVSPNPTHHHGSADHHAETPSTPSPT